LDYGKPGRPYLDGIEYTIIANPSTAILAFVAGKFDMTLRGHRELITVIGHAAVIAAGEWVTASGEWVNDRTHGQQFKSRFMRTSAPTSIEGTRNTSVPG
jgi:ABC-type transport system substrate-binding protein